MSVTILAVAIVIGCSGQTPSQAPADASSSASASSTASATTATSFPPAAVTIDAHGEDETPAFTPATIDISSGDIVRIVDVGDTLHDFTIDVDGKVPTKPEEQHIALQIKVDLLNTTNQAPVDLPAGTYQFYCSVSLGNGAGHAINGMVGTITVR